MPFSVVPVPAVPNAICCSQGGSYQLQGVLTVPQGHRAVSAELLPSQAMSRLPLCLRLWFPRSRAWRLSMLNCTRSIPAAWPSSPGWQPCSPVVTSFPGFMSPASKRSKCSFPSPWPWGKMLNKIYHSMVTMPYQVLGSLQPSCQDSLRSAIQTGFCLTAGLLFPPWHSNLHKTLWKLTVKAWLC